MVIGKAAVSVARAANIPSIACMYVFYVPATLCTYGFPQNKLKKCWWKHCSIHADWSVLFAWLLRAFNFLAPFALVERIAWIVHVVPVVVLCRCIFR